MSTSTAFIFDLDGTLVDSLQDITNAINCALHAARLPTVTPREVREWIGDGLPTLCRRAAHIDRIETVNAMVKTATAHYARHCVDHTRPYRNILEMLRLLQRRRIPLAVLSNKPHALTVRVLERLDMHRHFHVIRGCTSEEDRKPSPHNALQIAEQCGVAPSRVHFVGDSVTDIHTARNAGMIAIAVTWGFQKKTELLAAEPDLVVNEPDEIPRIS